MTHNWEDLELAFNAARKPIPMQPFKHWMRFNKFKDYKKYVMSKAKCLYCGSLIYDSNANYQKIHDPETCPMNPTKPLLPSAGGVKWVKASERLPEKDWKGIAKTLGIDGNWIYQTRTGWEVEMLLSHELDLHAEWLDEGQPAQGK